MLHFTWTTVCVVALQYLDELSFYPKTRPLEHFHQRSAHTALSFIKKAKRIYLHSEIWHFYALVCCISQNGNNIHPFSSLQNEKISYEIRIHKARNTRVPVWVLRCSLCIRHVARNLFRHSLTYNHINTHTPVHTLTYTYSYICLILAGKKVLP